MAPLSSIRGNPAANAISRTRRHRPSPMQRNRQQGIRGSRRRMRNPHGVSFLRNILQVFLLTLVPSSFGRMPSASRAVLAALGGTAAIAGASGCTSQMVKNEDIIAASTDGKFTTIDVESGEEVRHSDPADFQPHRGILEVVTKDKLEDLDTNRPRNSIPLSTGNANVVIAGQKQPGKVEIVFEPGLPDQIFTSKEGMKVFVRNGFYVIGKESPGTGWATAKGTVHHPFTLDADAYNLDALDAKLGVENGVGIFHSFGSMRRIHQLGTRPGIEKRIKGMVLLAGETQLVDEPLSHGADERMVAAGNWLNGVATIGVKLMPSMFVGGKWKGMVKLDIDPAKLTAEEAEYLKVFSGGHTDANGKKTGGYTWGEFTRYIGQEIVIAENLTAYRANVDPGIKAFFAQNPNYPILLVTYANDAVIKGEQDVAWIEGKAPHKDGLQYADANGLGQIHRVADALVNVYGAKNVRIAIIPKGGHTGQFSPEGAQALFVQVNAWLRSELPNLVP